MKIEYKFVTGERVELEVNDEFTEIMIELDHKFNNHDRKETRRHESLDSNDKDFKNTDVSSDIYGKVLKNLDKDKLYDAIKKLTFNEQDLLHKLYLDSNPISQAQYAKHLNIRENKYKRKKCAGKIKAHTAKTRAFNKKSINIKSHTEMCGFFLHEKTPR